MRHMGAPTSNTAAGWNMTPTQRPETEPHPWVWDLGTRTTREDDGQRQHTSLSLSLCLSVSGGVVVEVVVCKTPLDPRP